MQGKGFGKLSIAEPGRAWRMSDSQARPGGHSVSAAVTQRGAEVYTGQMIVYFIKKKRNQKFLH